MINIKKNIAFLVFFIIFIFQTLSFAECIEGDCENGTGKFVYDNDSYYLGEWKDGYMHGYGKYVWPSGTFYEGELKKNFFHGQGRKTYADGTYEEGYFENDKLVDQNSYKEKTAKTYWEGALNCYRYTDNPIKESQRPYIDQLTLLVQSYQNYEDPYLESDIIMLSEMIVDNLSCTRDVFR